MSQPPNAQVAVLRERIEQMRQVKDFLASDFFYQFEQLVAAHDLLRTRYAPFKVGDCVQLTRTPVIDETHAPGWLGSKHFLVAGAPGTVRDVFVMRDALYCRVEFDDESWIDDAGQKRFITVNRHVYTFNVDDLAPLSPGSPIPVVVVEPDLALDLAVERVRAWYGHLPEVATVLTEVERLRQHRYCGDAYPENGWPEVTAVLARYAALKRARELAEVNG